MHHFLLLMQDLNIDYEALINAVWEKLEVHGTELFMLSMMIWVVTEVVIKTWPKSWKSPSGQQWFVLVWVCGGLIYHFSGVTDGDNGGQGYWTLAEIILAGAISNRAHAWLGRLLSSTWDETVHDTKKIFVGKPK